MGLVRIDDRLIHGQVIAVCCKHRRFSRIIIVDDGVAADPFMQEVLSLAAPPGLRVDVFSIEDGINVLNEDPSNWGTTMVLMKSPSSAKRLYDGGLEYNALVMKAGSEFDLLLNLPEEEVEKLGGEMMGAAVSRMRRREVSVEEGFDGEFGKICLFPEKSPASTGPSLFTTVKNGAGDTAGTGPLRLIRFNLGEYKRLTGRGRNSDGREVSPEPKGNPERPYRIQSRFCKNPHSCSESR